ncbi:MAG: hypothetical protein V4690_01705 [Patescibacteria group bacterium]
MNKANLISIIVASTLVGISIILVLNKPREVEVPVNNVSIVDGVQIIEIDAKGGYKPGTSYAKAGLPTIVRFNTKNTFDCSLIVSIPSLGINQTLNQNGSTDINIGQSDQGSLAGSCGMGMYPFDIEFSS